MNPKDQRIMDILSDGPKTTPEIAKAYGDIKPKDMFRLCRSLERYRFITRRTVRKGQCGMVTEWRII